MSSTSRSWPFGRGIVAGLVAFVAGYLVTYLWQEPGVRESLQGVNVVIQFFGGDAIPAWKAVGWLYFNAHFVRTELPGLGGPQTRNFIAAGDAPALLYAVPVVVLLAAGFAVAWFQHAGGVQEAAMDGATVALGYVVAAIAAAFVFAVTRGDASIAPDAVTAVLLAGIVYPLVLGTVGGGLAGALQSSRADTSRHPN